MTWDRAYANLKQTFVPGSEIKRSNSGRTYCVDSWFDEDGQENLRYTVANKVIPVVWIRVSFEQLMTEGELRTAWFIARFYDGKDLGGCNFTTIGALLCGIGVAVKAKRGLYRLKS